MTPRSFAKILVASDGQQVLFVVDIDPLTGQHRVQGLTTVGGGVLCNHQICFEDPVMAYASLDAYTLEQADMMRDVSAVTANRVGVQ